LPVPTGSKEMVSPSIAKLGCSSEPKRSMVTSGAFGIGPLPEVSVVISTRNRTDFLPGLLDALSAQTYDRNLFEVIMVDDASSDGTWRTLETLVGETDLRLCSIRLAAQGGQGPGRNAGVAHARAAIVAFTDDDCLPAPGWLEAIGGVFRPESGSIRSCVVVQGRTLPWEVDEYSGGVWARTIWVLRPTWLFETCNIAYRRVDLIQAGGFPGPEDAPVTKDGKLVGEDAILGWHVTEGGARLTFNPEALVYHRHHAASYVDWLRDLRGRSVFPVLVRRDHRARRALWGRYFLAPRTAAFDVAIATTALWIGTRRTRWLLGVLPWLWITLPEAADRRGRHPAVRIAQMGLGDLVSLQALIRSSVRERRIVL
jgi:glycosyltransferase involved in cell wall biosynthesis